MTYELGWKKAEVENENGAWVVRFYYNLGFGWELDTEALKGQFGCNFKEYASKASAVAGAKRYVKKGQEA